MGQYLSIGIVTKIGVSKAEVDKAELSLEQLQQEMTQNFRYASEIYDTNEKEGVYYFQLKEDIINKQLLPFLKSIYPFLYDDSEYYDDVIEKIEKSPSSQWLSWAKEKPEEAFQLDEYGEQDHLQVGFSDIRINYDVIMLSMEGKIMMEVYGRQFNFFQYTMAEAFKEFTLAKALRVYITG